MFLAILIPLISAAWGSVPLLSYVGETSLRPEAILALPPPRDSAAGRADFAEILARQASRSDEGCRRAAAESSVSLATFFGAPYGMLDAAEQARLALLFEKVRQDTDWFVQAAKRHWGRPRPYQADPRVNPCIRLETTAAYPSGHAAISRVFARVLGQFLPGRAEAFLARADQIGADRVLAGVHHPSDIEAGKRLGDAVYARLLRSPAFQSELRALRPQPPEAGSVSAASTILPCLVTVRILRSRMKWPSW